MDEIAHAAGADPLEFRLRLLPQDSRLRGVLEVAAEKSGWGKPLAPRKGRGIAAHFCFGSYVAQVADVTVSEKGALKLDRIVSAVDCGYYVHPDILRAQIEGGIIFGLSGALSGEITVGNGRIQQTNFDGFTPLAMGDAPVIEVHVKESTDAPGGIGEPGLPPAVPAVCNAIFAACGKRIRKLPIGRDDLK
jgi:isoquinoline 1-oxidoreductase beta subunit